MPPTAFHESRLKALGLAAACLIVLAATAAGLVLDDPGPFGVVALLLAASVAAVCLVPLLRQAVRPRSIALSLDAEGFGYRGLRVDWDEVTGHTSRHVYRRGTVVVVHVEDPHTLAARWRAAGLHGADRSLRTWGTPLVLDTAGLDARPRRVVAAFAAHADPCRRAAPTAWTPPRPRVRFQAAVDDDDAWARATRRPARPFRDPEDP